MYSYHVIDSTYALCSIVFNLAPKVETGHANPNILRNWRLSSDADGPVFDLQ